MRAKIPIAIAVCALLVAQSAQGMPTNDCVSPGKVVRFSLIHKPCPYYAQARSCYEPSTRIVYLVRFDYPTYLHELGHAYDSQTLNDADRAELSQFLTLPGPWGDGKLEEFADDFADCELPAFPWLLNQPLCGWLDAHPARFELEALRL